MSKVDLRLDWCSYEAAKYAVEHWHYSRTMPMPPYANVGVWEDGKFIGAVIFSRGANPNLGKPFGLDMLQCAELVRVAMTKHKTEVSRVLSISCRMIKKQYENLRLIISFADTRENHHGGIYQAAGWVYSGETAKKFDFEFYGKILQRRRFTGKNFGGGKIALPPGAKKVESPEKYRYLYPLDDAMRKQIEPLRKPYPKRGTGETDNAPAPKRETEGASPIVPLLEEE